MRLAVVLALVLLIPTWLVAQHSAGGGSSSGGSSHSSSVSSGGFSSPSRSSSMSSPGNSRSSVSSTSSPKAASDAWIHAQNAPTKVEPKKPTHFFLWRHKEAAKPAAFAERFPFGCKKGQICTCPGGGARNAAGNCASVQYLSCGLGLSWNNYGCGQQYWFNNCRALADQLSAVQRQMLGQTGAAVSLRYRLLQDEYERCQHAFHRTLPWLASRDYN
jgi:hypothetical protein